MPVCRHHDAERPALGRAGGGNSDCHRGPGRVPAAVYARGVLDSLLIIGRRPPPGTAVDVSALTNVELTDPVQTSGVEIEALVDEVTKRLGSATSNIEIQRLNSISTALGHKIKLGRGADGAIAVGDGTYD